MREKLLFKNVLLVSCARLICSASLACAPVMAADFVDVAAADGTKATFRLGKDPTTDFLRITPDFNTRFTGELDGTVEIRFVSQTAPPPDWKQVFTITADIRSGNGIFDDLPNDPLPRPYRSLEVINNKLRDRTKRNIPAVPGPLPLLGVGVAFSRSRQLRQLSR